MKTQEQPKIYIGIDLGDRKHQVCVTDKDGTVLSEKSMTNDFESFALFASQYPNATVALEVGTHSPWISKYLESLGLEVFVANPRKLKYISENIRKSDVRDARILAKFVRLDPELLCPIKHRSVEAQKDLVQIKLRDALVRNRVGMIVALRGILKSFGIRLPSCSTPFFAKRAEEFIKENHSDHLQSVQGILESIKTITAQIKEYDKAIYQAVEEHYPEAKRLMTIPGVAAVSALTFILSIEDPNRFDKSREVGAFLGLVPKRNQSGNRDKELSISKAGDKYVRRLLVQCSQYMLGAHAKDSALRDWGLNYIKTGGQNAKKKAIVAMARKLSTIMMSLWKNEEDYTPYPNGKPQKTLTITKHTTSRKVA